jgi:hypothetical protein
LLKAMAVLADASQLLEKSHAVFVAPATEPGPNRLSTRRSASRSVIGSRIDLTVVRDDTVAAARACL